MREGIRRTLFTAAAAGATITGLGFAAASPAVAASPAAAAGHRVKAFTPSGGTPIPTNANCPVSVPISPPHDLPVIVTPADNCARAGYQASGRDFRFAQALITVPDHPGSIDTGAPPDGITGADPVLYVALDDSGTNTYQYTRVGVAPCPAGASDVFVVPNGPITCPTTDAGNTSDWVVFAAVMNGGIPAPSSPVVDVRALSSADMGDAVLVSAHLAPTGNAVQTVIQLPDGSTYNNTFPVPGPVYTHAQAVADWTTAIENGASAPQPSVASAKGRVSQFFQGRFSTASGQQGTFAGPWTLNSLEVTSNGTLPPAGTLMTQPSYLWNDQHGFNGLGRDAFGVWSFPF